MFKKISLDILLCHFQVKKSFNYFLIIFNKCIIFSNVCYFYSVFKENMMKFRMNMLVMLLSVSGSMQSMNRLDGARVEDLGGLRQVRCCDVCHECGLSALIVATCCLVFCTDALVVKAESSRDRACVAVVPVMSQMTCPLVAPNKEKLLKFRNQTKKMN